MKRICLILIFIGFMPGFAAALGLGKLTLDSGLNQPFEARIELLSVTADELSTLKVRLADMEAFRRARIDRPFVLSQLQFQVEEPESGADYIHVFSKDPIREPYLDFLVEASWSKGRLFREYTVLLDPPLYDPYAGQAAAAPASGPARRSSAPAPAPAPATAPAQPASYSGAFTGSQYGPVAAGETLWSIASKTRPDTSVSVQQMMLALLRTNPEAFINNNINGLKRGEVLRMPARSEIQNLDQAQAFREVRSQNSMWEEVRATTTQTPPVRAQSEGRGRAAPAVTSGEEQPELRLVTPAGKGEGQTGSVAQGELDKELSLANEQLETITQENNDLKSRLKESDGVINDLKRLVQLKDDELAALQNQAAAGETAAATEESGQPSGEEAPPQGETEAAAGQPQEQQQPAPEKAAAPAVVSAPAPAAPGLVDRLKQLVLGNLIAIAGILVAVIVVIIVLVFISRRRSAAPDQAFQADAAMAGVDEDEVETVFDSGQGSEPAEAVIAGTESITELPEGEQEEEPEEEDESEAATEFAAFEAEPEAAPEAAPEQAAPEAAEQPAEFDEEPLAEVNVFLAYEHFDQAEEFVRNAIEGEPNNLDYHVKLLEVFYAAGNKASYEAEARVLNDLVNGTGQHWDMATSMWHEMSPNRALFSEPVEGEEEAAAGERAGGMLDLTSGEEAPAEGAALDFDFGAEQEEAPAEDEGVLDISTASPEEDVLDVTAAISTSDADDQDLLDVTAAVGIEAEPEQQSESPEGDKDEIFDLTGSSSEEPVLDITSGGDDEVLDLTTTSEPAAGEDLLDVSKVSGDDLLDVTSHAEFESEGMEEDLLDVTSATSAGVDSDALLEVDEEESESPIDEDSNALEFDITGSDDTATEDEAAGDNVIEFDTGSGSQPEEDVLTLDEEPAADTGLSIEGDEPSGEESEGLEIDLSVDDQQQDAGAPELSLDEGSEDSGAEIDLTIGEEDSGLSLDMGEETPELSLDSEDSDSGFELELDTGEDETPQAVSDLDMESTVQMPKLDIEADDEEDDDDEEHTVFVPRSSDASEQSQEDEVATKLDLAKAYVELGDSDSARGILEEIITDGNPQQQQQAQELLKQI